MSKLRHLINCKVNKIFLIIQSWCLKLDNFLSVPDRGELIKDYMQSASEWMLHFCCGLLHFCKW